MYQDEWKKDEPGHDAIRNLHERLRVEIKNRYQRGLPFADELFDRWDRAAFFGFGTATSIYDSSLVIGDVHVGDHCWIGPFTVLDGSGGLEIGSYCSLSAGVHIYSHDTVYWSLTGGRLSAQVAPVRIGSFTYVGPHVVVSRGVTIGSRCVIGANSLVNREIEDNSIAFGNPARVVGRVQVDGDRVQLLYE